MILQDRGTSCNPPGPYLKGRLGGRLLLFSSSRVELEWSWAGGWCGGRERASTSRMEYTADKVAAKSSATLPQSAIGIPFSSLRGATEGAPTSFLSYILMKAFRRKLDLICLKMKWLRHPSLI